MLKHLKWFLLFIFILPNCGIPSDDDFAILNPPLAVFAIRNASTGYIDITFIGNNTESNFTGYNVYMSTNAASDVVYQHTYHVVDGVENTTIADGYIVKNKTTSSWPTIQESDGGNFTSVLSGGAVVTYTLEYPPSNWTSLSNVTWYIGLSAFSRSNNIESSLSNVEVLDR